MEEISDIIKSKIDLEAQRQAEILGLVDTLRKTIETEQAEIVSEDHITSEMMQVRSKLKAGSIRSQLDDLLDQKKGVTRIDRALVDDLSSCLNEMESILEDSKKRAALMQSKLNGLAAPDTKKDTPFDWTDFEELDRIWNKATEDITASKQLAQRLRDRVEGAVFNKSAILGEDLHHHRNAGDTIAHRSRLTRATIDLKGKDERELIGVLAKTAGSALLGGSKAALFGMKTLVDSVTSSGDDSSMK
jgi:hypothetical protein